MVGPTTNKRSANTAIIVKDQQTVVVGGLIRDNITKSVRKVPFLGDIPILGWLFKIQTRRTEKTNLLIFLTPYIVRESSEVVQIRKNKSEEMRDYLEREKVEQRQRHEEILDKFDRPMIPPPDPPQAEGDEVTEPQTPKTPE